MGVLIIKFRDSGGCSGSMPSGLDRWTLMFQGSNANARSRHTALRHCSFLFRNSDNDREQERHTCQFRVDPVTGEIISPRPLPLY